MDEHAKALAQAIEEALPRWVERSVERRLLEATGAADDAVRGEAREAGRRAQAEVAPRVWDLLNSDIDEQRSTPLAIVREAVRYPTAVLHAAGIPPVECDRQQERLFPDDVYDLAPASFADLDPAVGDAGLTWGAAKAYTHLERHRPKESDR